MHFLHYIAWAFYSCIVATAAVPSNTWNLKTFKSLVTFGDSYTDESRFVYYFGHNGSIPPVGWVDPINNDTSSGGYTWPRYVSNYTGVNLYDYAISGASCSNLITPRTFTFEGITVKFPSLLEYAVPAYIADSKYVTASGQKFLDIPPEETVYSIWIGTNDLGVDALLTDSQVANKTISDYIECVCVYTALDRIYANGARYFVLMNIAPMQLTPLYATPERGGVGNTFYWPHKPDNRTEISYRMWEQVITVNDIYKYKTPFELLVARRYPGAHFAVMDMYSLISDIFNHPMIYLNGTAPANVTGYINHCSINDTDCIRQPSPDSYLWFDPLHPSQRTDQIIARNFVEVAEGKSKWATYW